MWIGCGISMASIPHENAMQEKIEEDSTDGLQGGFGYK